MKKLWIIAAAAGIAVAAGVGVSTARSAAGSHQLTHLRYATSFGNFGRDAYVYVAIAKGYFKAAGFDVTVTAGNGSEDDMRLIAAKKSLSAWTLGCMAFSFQIESVVCI